MQTVQGFQIKFLAWTILRTSLCLTDQELRKSFTWWNQLLCRSVLTPNSCTKFKIHSAHADNPGVPNPISSLNIFEVGPVFASQIKNSGRALPGGTNSFAGQFLHQTPVQSSRSIQHMQTVHGVPNQISSLNNFEDHSLPYRSWNSGRALLGGTNCFAGQFLHQTSVQSSRSIQHKQTVQGFQIKFLAWKILRTSLCLIDQELRKSFSWWNQLLWRLVLTPNSCTRFKIHSAHADSPGSKSNF